MPQKTYRLVFAIIILLAFSLSCNLISTANEIKSTAEAAATQVKQGSDLLSTGQTVVTQIKNSGMAETAQALATQFAESGFQETVKALPTQYADRGLQETVQAYATEFGDSNILQTAQAVTTQFSLSPENVPQDIPLLEGEKNAFIASPQIVSYFIEATFEEALSFYQREMPAHGWIVKDEGTVVTEDSADLYYENNDRKAKVVINVLPYLDQTSIIISLETIE